MLKKSLTIFIAVSFFLADAQDVSAIRNSVDVYGNNSLVGTSKYNSMAGSMGALGGDISVVNSNPAGIGVFITSDISATLNVIGNKNTTTFGSSAYDYTINNTDLGQIGGVVAFEVGKNSPWKFVNFAVNFTDRNIDDYTESAGNSNITYSVGSDELEFAGHAYDRIGNVSKMSFALGGNYDNRIYLGAGINIHSSSISQYDTAAMSYSDGTYELFDKQYTPYGEDASGFSANIGIIGKASNQLRLGAALETPTWWKVDRTYSYYGYDGSDDGVYSETRHFTSPLKATLSAAFVPNKNFALNVDYSLGLTQPKYTSDSDEVEQEFKDFYSDHYKNISEIRIGAEYRVQQFRLRAGYAFASNPFDNITLNAFNNDGTTADQTFDNLYVGKRNIFGIGLGYDFKAFYIDAAYNNITSEYSSPFLYGSNAAGSEYYSSSAYIYGDTSAVSKVKNNQNNFTFTIGWKF